MKTETSVGSFTREVRFEKRNKWIDKVKGSLLRVAGRYISKERTTSELRDYLGSEFKIGYGGSHVWVSNSKDERLMIIYFLN
jgi:hypothetical protein